MGSALTLILGVQRFAASYGTAQNKSELQSSVAESLQWSYWGIPAFNYKNKKGENGTAAARPPHGRRTAAAPPSPPLAPSPPQPYSEDFATMLDRILTLAIVVPSILLLQLLVTWCAGASRFCRLIASALSPCSHARQVLEAAYQPEVLRHQVPRAPALTALGRRGVAK
jgi:hypothetical protein